MIDEFLKKYAPLFDETVAIELQNICSQFGTVHEIDKNRQELEKILSSLSVFVFILKGKLTLDSGKNKRRNGSLVSGDMLLNFFPHDITTMEINESLQILVVEKHHFYNLFQERPEISKQFHQFISFLISEQIEMDEKQTESELARLKSKFVGEIQKDVVLEKLERSKDSINETGSSIIDKLIGLMADVKLIKNSPELPPSLQETADRLFNRFMDIVASDTQNFDILFQQLNAIQQNLKNIVSVVYGEETQPQQGDKNIFAVKLAREKREDYGEMEVF